MRYYLRVRGEYCRWLFPCPATWELPPRARRILPSGGPKLSIGGTTSACAENTQNETQATIQIRNYLRVRGEYRRWLLTHAASWELPPRARRILVRWARVAGKGGTTSACAENTGATPFPLARNRNYLRVRGEYPRVVRPHRLRWELPPRARRIRIMTPRGLIRRGTTSACAENTFHKPCGEVAGGNYLRVRGEYLL